MNDIKELKEFKIYCNDMGISIFESYLKLNRYIEDKDLFISIMKRLRQYGFNYTNRLFLPVTIFAKNLCKEANNYDILNGKILNE